MPASRTTGGGGGGDTGGGGEKAGGGEVGGGIGEGGGGGADGGMSAGTPTEPGLCGLTKGRGLSEGEVGGLGIGDCVRTGKAEPAESAAGGRGVEVRGRLRRWRRGDGGCGQSAYLWPISRHLKHVGGCPRYVTVAS